MAKQPKKPATGHQNKYADKKGQSKDQNSNSKKSGGGGKKKK